MIDAVRAYFHALARRRVYARLPDEDKKEGYCGRLLKAMYGTRDAAQNWEAAYADMLERFGFKRGVSSACVFWHPELDMRLVVHGGDFTVLGSECSLDKFREYVSTCMQVKFKARIGGGGEEATRILNRVIQGTKEGLEYEADQRHAEIVIRDMGLRAESKGVGTPGMQDLALQDMQIPAGCDETKYRAMAARVNYLSQDRPDIQYAVKEVCRRMSQPDEEDWARIKRLARYLKEYPRMVQKFEPQDMPKDLEIWVDTDFAGCRKIRKSTSGGVAMLGNRCLKTWSSTQEVVALSSGEAELH